MLGVGVCACCVFSACGEDSGDGDGTAGGNSAAAGSEAGVSGDASAGAEPGAAGASSTAGSDTGGEPQGGAANCPAGAPGEPPEDYLAERSSGSRLEVRYISAPGLPPVFAEVFDTELGVLCDFAWASDDELRCLPRSTVFDQHVGFADAGCRQDIGELSPACSGKAAYVRRSLGCRDKYDVGLLVPHSGPLYRGNVDNCALSADTPGPNLYTFGEAIPPQTFVAGQLEELPGVCHATLRVVVSEDGARVPYEVIDIATGAACDAIEEGCTPKYRAFEEPHLYSDASCETRVEERYGGWEYAFSCGPPDFISPLGDKSIWYRPGAMPSDELYWSPTACEPVLDSPWLQSLYELGTATPLSDLAPLDTVRLGDLRLQVNAAAEQAKPLLVARGFFAELHDTERDEPCMLQRLADGSVRCIPSAASFSGFAHEEYEDADCTVPVRRCPGDCLGRLFFDAAADVCSDGRPTTGIWRATANATGYYLKSSGLPCAAGGDLSGDMWRVEAVDPTTFAAAILEAAP